MPLRLNGATSGYVQLAAPNAAGSTSLVLPTDSVQPGMVLVATSSFTTASTVSVDGCFTSTYDNYRILLRYASSNATQSALYIRLRGAGSDNSAASYNSQELLAYSTTVNGNAYNAATAWTGGMPVSNSTSLADTLAMDIYGPALAEYTNMHTHNYGYQSNVSQWVIRTSGHQHQVATAFDGFSFYLAASYNITGTVRVYGYRNSITT